MVMHKPRRLRRPVETSNIERIVELLTELRDESISLSTYECLRTANPFLPPPSIVTKARLHGGGPNEVPKVTLTVYISDGGGRHPRAVDEAIKAAQDTQTVTDR